MRDLMTELRQKGSMRAGSEKRLGKRGRRGGGAEVGPGQCNRLTPRPKVLSSRLAEPAEWAHPKGAAQRAQMAGKWAMLQACRGLKRMKCRVHLAGVEKGPFGRGGGPGPQAPSAPLSPVP